MIRKDLLEKELQYYKRKGKELKPVKFNKDIFFNLFKKYKYYGMTVSSYCCYGEEHCCWQDPYAEGIWDMNLKGVRNIILSDIKSSKHYIRNRKQGNRFYMYQDKDCCYIHIYCRDTEITTDFDIWFNNKDEYNL